MTLLDGKAGESYKVKELMTDEDVMRRLEVLGINEDTNVKILNRKRNGSMIIKVRGSRLAIGRNIAACIEVREGE
ncbi:FeoA family protein [Anaerobium acetethylicum]|uniref:Ferrous iron transport protein A n=1 Tax=Anaerobium acetethylicum TaxID=1619234 RepID=A0A1D3TVB6_9FIRM|nr:ferrous iron transport protein A [Anaerobium acetethylicum]SCP98090.1 ferrous iron transport protein A [Anaerobium acetethylicum]